MDAVKEETVVKPKIRRNPAEIEFMDFEIDRNHLLRQARFLSEGALHVRKTPSLARNDPGALDAEDAKKAVKRKTIKVKMQSVKKEEDKIEDGAGSTESLHDPNALSMTSSTAESKKPSEESSSPGTGSDANSTLQETTNPDAQNAAADSEHTPKTELPTAVIDRILSKVEKPPEKPKGAWNRAMLGEKEKSSSMRW